MIPAATLDDVRAYWDARPCNLRHSTKEVGTRAYFDEVERRKYLVEPHIPGFAEFSRWEGKRVLELGCGIGTDTMNFLRAGAEVTAVDLSEASLALAQQRAKVYGFRDVRFIHSSIENLGEVLKVEPYDLVYSFGVIHHTPRPWKAVQSAHSYMGPTSAFKMMVYNRHSLKALGLRLRGGIEGLYNPDATIARQSEAQAGCPVTYTYTKDSVTALLERYFVVDSINVEHIFPYRIADYVQHRYVREWYYDIMPPGMFDWLEHRVGWHLCVTARRG